MCVCADKPIVVPYVPVRKKAGKQARHYYAACRKCDSVDLWPVFHKQPRHAVKD